MKLPFAVVLFTLCFMQQIHSHMLRAEDVISNKPLFDSALG